MCIRDSVQQGNKVKITENQLTFYSTVGVKTIQLTPAEVVSLNITHFKLEKDQLRLLRDRLLARNLERRIGLPLDERAKHIFKKMSQKQKVWTLSEWQEVTNYLIGRGKGLTPVSYTHLHAFGLNAFIGDERDEVYDALAAEKIHINSSVPITPNTIPPIMELLRHGVNVHLGCDNIYDCWSPYGLSLIHI